MIFQRSFTERLEQQTQNNVVVDEDQDAKVTVSVSTAQNNYHNVALVRMKDLGVIQPQTMAPHRSKSFHTTSHSCSIKISFFFSHTQNTNRVIHHPNTGHYYRIKSWVTG